MWISDGLNVNEKGHLTIDGCDTVELAKEYGTSLYVMNENVIRKNCKDYKDSIDKFYGGQGIAMYASKAFSCKEIYKIVADEGLGIDVVSGGEIYTALKAGFPMDKVMFHGNNKTDDEIKMALDVNIGNFVVDNLYELERLNKAAKEADKVVNIMFRIKPGIDAHTHSFIRTGQIDSKFGLALENGEAMVGVKKAIEMENVKLNGLHCHIGSQIFDIAPFELAAKVMIEFIAQIKKETGYEIEGLNLGGGFGIKYMENDEPKPYGEYMERVSKTISATCEELGVKMPYIYLEPGRSIVGEAGITLYTVGAVKEIENVRTYVAIDGGMIDNPRYILYQSSYELLIANKANQPRDYKATVAGKCCESGDLIQENAFIQKPEPGDIMAVLATGAYNYSMASNYNRIPRPAVVMVKDSVPRIIVNAESYEDIIRNDV